MLDGWGRNIRTFGNNGFTRHPDRYRDLTTRRSLNPLREPETWSHLASTQLRDRPLADLNPQGEVCLFLARLLEMNIECDHAKLYERQEYSRQAFYS